MNIVKLKINLNKCFEKKTLKHNQHLTKSFYLDGVMCDTKVNLKTDVYVSSSKKIFFGNNFKIRPIKFMYSSFK